MDQKERKTVKNPRENANILKIVTFGWLLKTFVKGYKKDLEAEDIFSPLNEHSSTVLGDRIEKNWSNEKKKDKVKGFPPTLLRALMKCFGKWIIIIGIVQGLWEFVVRVYQPLILARLLRFLSGKDTDSRDQIYLWALGFVVCCFIDVYVSHFTMYGLNHLGLKLRVACTTLIYRKILRLSTSVLDNGTSIGQMVNLINTDVNRLDYMVFSIHYLWIGPIQTLIITYFVWAEIGWPAIIGSLTFLFFVPLQVLIGKLVSKLTKTSAYRTDERLRLMNEIVSGIEVIKMYVWEKPFSKLVEKARRKEINTTKKFSIIEEITFTFERYVPRLSLFLTILSYVLVGNHIDAEKVYMITAFYGVLGSSMSTSFPMSISELVEGLVSIKRLQKFMLQPEVENPSDERKSCAPTSSIISLNNVTAKWSPSCTDNTLSDVSLSIEPGQFVAIVGEVGAGKSSLLQAVLRELPLSSGSVERSGKIAYASQMPWIFSSTVRQNILFGQPMDQARYERTLQVCQLKPDIVTFSHGDMTMVGPRGISLSGGQRARINLARAIYSQADIYLLDDPLSAVDSHVGRRIVEDCICGYLKGKTRMLATHQLQYLNNADLVVVVNRGRIQAQGTYDEIRAAGVDLTKLVELSEKATSPSEEKIDPPFFSQNGISRTFEAANGEKPDKLAEEKSNEVKERKEVGGISSKVYISYLKSVRSPFLVFLTFLVMISSQCVGTGGDYFLAHWVTVEESSALVTENGTIKFEWQSFMSRDWFVYIYCLAVVATIVLCLYQVFVYFAALMRACVNLHNDMFRSITRTTMIFFNVNPSGRVLNRFSKDMYAIDKRLPGALMDVLTMVIMLFAILIIIGIVNPWLLIPIIILAVVFSYLRAFYMSTSRNIKRLEGVTRSPVNDHVTVTLQGLTTLRAFRAQDMLSLEFDRHHDVNTSTFFMFMSTSRAFGFYLHFFCTIYVSLITYVVLVFDDLVVAADAGFILTQCILFTTFLQWGLRQTAEVESNMTSVERVLEYSKLEEEPQLESDPEKKPPNDWPHSGHLEFKDVRLKYSPQGGYVLKGLTFEVNPKEKVGIVGRTGAGKTSLISSLFRLAPVEGEILIDGISTGGIGLHDFRSKISIIPQEPVLFAGSLRQNLDPFEEFPDDVLWLALEEVKLKGVVTAMELGLQARVSEGGSNFSVGQRQLLCLARAIIRNNKIMVLDEATANVDPLTDSLIQATVRRKFKDCTVLTIAHRLHTVMDSDRVLVMNAGQVVELDSPYKLLQNKNLFYSMVQQTGSAMAATLTKIAEDTYLNKNDEAPSR